MKLTKTEKLMIKQEDSYKTGQTNNMKMFCHTLPGITGNLVFQGILNIQYRKIFIL